VKPATFTWANIQYYSTSCKHDKTVTNNRDKCLTVKYRHTNLTSQQTWPRMLIRIWVIPQNCSFWLSTTQAGIMHGKDEWMCFWIPTSIANKLSIFVYIHTHSNKKCAMDCGLELTLKDWYLACWGNDFDLLNGLHIALYWLLFLWQHQDLKVECDHKAEKAVRTPIAESWLTFSTLWSHGHRFPSFSWKILLKEHTHPKDNPVFESNRLPFICIFGEIGLVCTSKKSWWITMRLLWWN